MIKIILVIFGLKLRTIINRLGIKIKEIDAIKQIPEINDAVLKPHNNVFFDFNRRRKDVEMYNSKQCLVLSRKFLVDDFVKDTILNKDDYLYLYTFFYLDFDISILDDVTLKCIFNSDISREPFVISQQIFNLIAKLNKVNKKDYNLIFSYLYDQYCYLCRNVEYHVDGNHVLENYMSICLYELYFFNKIKSFEILSKELYRQVDKFGHKERNAKYSYDILLKLLVLENLLNIKNHAFTFSKFIVYLKSSIIKFRYASFYSHDNINGDNLINDTNLILNTMPSWNPKIFLDVRPESGMSGHSFDLSYYISLPTNLKSFGTLHYANTKKRIFQRLRFNNNQFCLDKNDVSVFFWKSFRVLFRLPKIKLILKNRINVYETVISKSRLRLLSYKVFLSDSGWEVRSKNLLNYKVYCDKEPVLTRSQITCGNVKFIICDSDKVNIKQTVRASYLGTLVKCYSISISSNKFTLKKIK